MDCVGCEKCRLWGKLQVLGLGTALKIVFSLDDQNQLNQPVRYPLLFYSLHFLRKFRIMCLYSLVGEVVIC